MRVGAAPRRRPVRHKPKGPVDPGFGQRFRTLRQMRGLTQADLAGKDFTKAFISHIETGRTRVSLRAAEILASRLDVRVVDLMGADASPHATQFATAMAERQLAVGEPAEALGTVEGAIKSARGTERGQLRRLEARALLALGRPREAVAPLTEALRACNVDVDKELRVRILYDLAYVHASLDEPGEAMGLLLDCARALASGDIVDRTLELQTSSLLAGLFAHIGDHASADLQAERATKLAEDVVDIRALDTLYASLAVMRREQGDLEGALVYARKALKLHERDGREAEAVHAWNNLAVIFIERGQHGRAEEALEKAEKLKAARGQPAGYLRVTRARLELARGHSAEALALATTATQDDSMIAGGRAEAALIVAHAFAQRRTPLRRVREAFERALDLYRSQPPMRRAQAHEAYAEVLAARGAHPEAYRHAQTALRLRRAPLTVD